MDMKSHEKKRVQANLDKDLVDQAEQVFNDVGLNTTSALTAFYKKVVATDGIPFKLTRLSPSEQLEREIQKKIDAGQYKKIDSEEKLAKFLKNN
ncbi:type II toxin-antitoxin system RelB/DinJ family antitoxin [Companilactobacillus sp. HBUAS59699]|uniref:type II toxin-antitoxin system RelB/DinJ family antitoxin n=1 Tax=Companilactobacillus sp. HBUAS59699 TaxID=3109358 RepID=UPI002FF195DC